MRSYSRVRHLAILLMGYAALAAAQAPPAQQPADAKPAPANAAPADKPANNCVQRCEKAEATCSSQVRRARQECSKKAANSGRDPMLMRRNYSSYFCGYFGSNDYCSRDAFNKDCRSRFNHRHGICVDTIEGNIAAQRYDCYLNERDAQTFCRDELRDCKETCGS